MGIAEMAVDTLQKFNQPVPQPPQYQPQPQNRFDLDIPDDDLVDGRKVKQILGALLQNQGAPVDMAARNLGAQGILAGLRMERSEEFRRWGREINDELAKLPVEYWTVDNLATIVNIVKSRHIDELVADKAERLVNESHPTIRSGSGGSGGVPQNKASVFETGSPELLSRLRNSGINNETDLRVACEGTGIQPAEFLKEFEKFGKGGVVRG